MSSCLVCDMVVADSTSLLGHMAVHRAWNERALVPVSKLEADRLFILTAPKLHPGGRVLWWGRGGPDCALSVCEANNWALVQLLIWRGIPLTAAERNYAELSGLELGGAL